MNVLELANQASNVSSREMKELLEEVIQLLQKEREKGKIGSEKVKGGLIELQPKGEALVVGDLHGDLNSLVKVLENSQFLKKVKRNRVHLIFLGDYGDRGEETLEVYWVVLKLKSIFPENVILLRGNHEGPQDLGVHPFDLPYFLRRRYAENWRELFLLFPQLFDYLPHALIVKGKYIMLHGGLPENITSIEDIAKAHLNHPAKDYLTQILWNDPGKMRGSCPSPRGAGIIFGEDISEEILGRLGLKTLIRSHEPCEGVAVTHKGKVLTIFSRKGPPYYNLQAAYLNIDLFVPARDAFQLARDAHLF